MKANSGTWEYHDENNNVTVFINYLITDESFDHHFGTEYKIGIEPDLDRVEDENGDPITIDTPEIESVIEEAFEAFDNVPLEDLLDFDVDEEGRYRKEDMNTVGWQYLHNKNIIWS